MYGRIGCVDINKYRGAMYVAPRYLFYACGTRLADEQQFAVLGQRPHLVVNHQFELVDVVAYLVE